MIATTYTPSRGAALRETPINPVGDREMLIFRNGFYWGWSKRSTRDAWSESSELATHLQEVVEVNEVLVDHNAAKAQKIDELKAELDEMSVRNAQLHAETRFLCEERDTFLARYREADSRSQNFHEERRASDALISALNQRVGELTEQFGEAMDDLNQKNELLRKALDILITAIAQLDSDLSNDFKELLFTSALAGAKLALASVEL